MGAMDAEKGHYFRGNWGRGQRTDRLASESGLLICPGSLGKGLSLQIYKMGAQTCTSQH